MTRAFDIVTIIHAIQSLEKEFLTGGREWTADANEKQKNLFHIYGLYNFVIDKIKDIKAKGSTDWEVLNKFLISKKFKPIFYEPLDGVGVISIIDKLIKLESEGKNCEINSKNNTYPGFELPKDGFFLYEIEGTERPLVELITQSNNRLFIIITPEKIDDVKIFEFAQKIMGRMRSVQNPYSKIRIPKVDFDVDPDISFLVGASTRDIHNQPWHIAQAKQQFKFRMN